MARALRSTLMASVVAVGLALAAPAAAQASTIYPPSDSCAAAPATVQPSGVVEFSCRAGTFSANEPVTITVTGEDGDHAAIGMVRTAIGTASGAATSEDDGSLASVRITFSAQSSGTFNIAAVSATSAGGTASATVTAAEGGLPVTGLDGSSLLGVWIGGGALVAAGAILAIVAAVRRSRARRD